MYKSIYNGEIKEAHTYKKNNIITGREGAYTYTKQYYNKEGGSTHLYKTILYKKGRSTHL